MAPSQVPDLLGAAAGLLIVGAYFLLQIDRMDVRSLPYSAVNALGAGLILFSLVFDFKLEAMLVESFWLLVSCFGVVKVLRHRNRFRETPAARPPAGRATAHGERQDTR